MLSIPCVFLRACVCALLQSSRTGHPGGKCILSAATQKSLERKRGMMWVFTAAVPFPVFHPNPNRNLVIKSDLVLFIAMWKGSRYFNSVMNWKFFTTERKTFFYFFVSYSNLPSLCFRIQRKAAERHRGVVTRTAQKSGSSAERLPETKRGHFRANPQRVPKSASSSRPQWHLSNWPQCGLLTSPLVIIWIEYY